MGVGGSHRYHCIRTSAVRTGKERAVLKHRLRSGFFYLVYLLLILFLLLEGACRVGVVSSEFQRTTKRAKQVDSSTKMLILGDSFSLDMDDSAMGLLERAFEAKDIGVLNLARPGASPIYHLEKLKEFGEAFEPDLVLLNYYVGNDLTDTRRYVNRGRGTNSLKDRIRGTLSKLYLFHAWVEAKTNYANRRRLERVEASLEKESGVRADILNPFLYELVGVNPEQIMESLAVPPSPEIESLWETNKRVLLEAKAISERLGARFIVCVFPHSVQVNTDHYEFLSDIGFSLDKEFLTAARPQEMMAEFARENGIECFDLLPGFREHRDQRFYLENDDHWNEQGNAFAFRLIKEYLEGLGIL